MSNTFLEIQIEKPKDASTDRMNIELTKAVRQKGLIISVRGNGLFEDNGFASVELDKTEALILIKGLNAFINGEITATGNEKL